MQRNSDSAVNNNNNMVKILHINARSIVSVDKRVQIRNLILENDPDFVSINETHLGEFHNFNIGGYFTIRDDRKDKNGGGVLLLIRCGIQFDRIKLNKHSTFELAGIYTVISGIKIAIFSMYIPDNNRFSHRVFETINGYVNVPSIWLADFNFHHTSLGSNHNNRNGIKIKEIIDCMNCSHHLLMPNEPTYYGCSSASTIDAALIDENLLNTFGNIKINVLDQFSDHCPIVLSFNGNTLGVDNNKTVKSYDYVNWKRYNSFLIDELSKKNLPTMENISNLQIDQFANELQDVLMNADTKFVKKIEIKDNYLIMSNQSLIILREKRRLCRIKNRNRNDVDLRRRLNNEIKLIETMLKNSLRNDYKNMVDNQISSIDDTKKLFNYIKRVTPYKGGGRGFKSLFTNENKTDEMIDEIEILNAWAEKFERNHNLTVGDNSKFETDVQLSLTQLSTFNTFINFNENCPAFINNTGVKENLSIRNANDKIRNLISLGEVKNVIANGNNKRSHGHDETPMFAIKRWKNEIVRFVSILFNHCIANNYFPSCWKHANVVPIPKAGKDPELIGSYRPISMLSSIGKIFERLIELKIRNYLEDNKLLYEYQFGFRKGNATEHALSILQNDINDGLNVGKITSVVLLDIQAAFDTVWHEGLIHKMMKLGIDPILCGLTLSYLKNRTFTVNHFNKKSSFKKINAGVPQGSSISPLYFLIYVNDAPVFDGIKRLNFADDTSVYITSSCPKINIQRLQPALNDLIDWYTDWKIKINANKTTFTNMVGSYRDTKQIKRKFAREIPITIGTRAILPSKKFKYLGVLFSSDNRKISHIEYILEKARKVSGGLARILRSQKMNPKLKTRIYKMAIKPILTYGSALWFNTSMISSFQIERLRRFERKWLRHATNFHRDRGTFKYKRSGLLYSAARIRRLDVSICKNIISFFQRCESNQIPTINALANTGLVGNYQATNMIFRMNRDNTLMENDLFLHFNRKKNGGDLVYVTEQ